MNSYRTSKLNSERPGLSARVYDYEKDNNDSLDRTSKTSKLPKRTYSLEGKRIICSDRKSNANPKTSTSMIPRLDRNKHVNLSEKGFYKRVSTPNNSISREKKVNEQQLLKSPNSEKEKLSLEPKIISPAAETFHLQSSPSVRTCSLESKVNKDFICFKNNVLRIPEYWTDAGQTVTNILKNAVNIVTKQYPTADVESFEMEIQNILKATEVVKQQILSKTENIINRANKIYVDRSDLDSDPGEEDLQKITRKMEDLKNEVNVRKNVFGDLLKYGSEMKQLIELEKALKHKGLSRENLKKEFPGEANQNYAVEEQHKRLDGKKGHSVVNGSASEIKKREKSMLQSCGDILRQEVKTASGMDETNGKLLSELGREEKYTQTVNLWTAELYRKEEDLKELNKQITELQKICQDHISKFKSFNLQIKLRGLCNRAQHTSFSKEIQILNDEKMELAEKNSKLRNYNQDLESAIKQRDLDIHQKDRLINQQKKLLNVRDELIEMLKNKCNFEETKHFG